MKKDQLSFLIPNNLYGGNPFDQRSFHQNGSFLENIDCAFPINFLQPITPPPKNSTVTKTFNLKSKKTCCSKGDRKLNATPVVWFLLMFADKILTKLVQSGWYNAA